MLQTKHKIANVSKTSLNFDLYDATGGYSVSNTGGYGAPNSLVSYWAQAHLFSTVVGGAAVELWRYQGSGFFTLSNIKRLDLTTPLVDGVHKSELYLGITITLTNAERTTNTRITYTTPLPADVIQDFGSGYMSRTTNDAARFDGKMVVSALTTTYIDFTPLATDNLPAIGAPAANMDLVLWVKSENYFAVIDAVTTLLAKKLAASCSCDDRFKHAWSMLKQVEAFMALGNYEDANRVLNAVIALI